MNPLHWRREHQHIDGIWVILLAITHRRKLSGKWEWTMVNGVIDLILAGIVIFSFPGAYGRLAPSRGHRYDFWRRVAYLGSAGRTQGGLS